jgi:hypothetical protein
MSSSRVKTKRSTSAIFGIEKGVQTKPLTGDEHNGDTDQHSANKPESQTAKPPKAETTPPKVTSNKATTPQILPDIRIRISPADYSFLESKKTEFYLQGFNSPKPSIPVLARACIEVLRNNEHDLHQELQTALENILAERSNNMRRGA